MLSLGFPSSVVSHYRAFLLDPLPTPWIDRSKGDPRRHDLDALRAFAMLLGILLHATISFVPGAGLYWGIQDSNTSPAYGLVVAWIHGWRMPLFFLVSGFFTAMLWRKRGLRALIQHRCQRIFLPLLLAMVTVIPLLWAVWSYAHSRSPAKLPGASRPDVFLAVATGDVISLRRYLEQGGEIDVPGDRGSTPLQVATLFGRSAAAELLIDAGANLEWRNDDGLRAEDLLALDWQTTEAIAAAVRLPLEKDEWISGRDKIASLIETKTGRAPRRMPDRASRAGDGSNLSPLFTTPVFHHLWFLWFICWYVIAFGLIVLISRRLPLPQLPASFLTSRIRYVWLIPLTAVSQTFMNAGERSFGPETSTGLLPIPAVFAYYAIFFGYGILYYGAGDTRTEIGRGYGWKLLVSLVILLPLGLALQDSVATVGRWIDCLAQAGYAWLMSFGMIGLFHRHFGGQRRWVRYLSDASYWLYLTHLPLVIYLQFELSDWPLPSWVKLAIICVATTAILLTLYHFAVRDRWLGKLLNGKRATEAEPKARFSGPRNSGVASSAFLAQRDD